MSVKLASFLTVLLILFMVWNVQAGQVTVEYFYWTHSFCPECPPCPEEINELIMDIEIEYQGQVFVELYDIFEWSDPRLRDRLEQYNFTDFPAVVVNQEYKMEGEEEIDGDELRMVIDAYLSNGDPGVDTTPPSVSIPSYEPQPVMPNQEVMVSVSVSDMQSGVHNVVLSYGTDGGTTWTNTTMSHTTGDIYVGEIAGFGAETTVLYKVIGYDNAGNSVSTSTSSYAVETEASPPVETLTAIVIVIFVLCGIAIYVIKFRGK